MRFTNFDRSYQVMRYLNGTEYTEEFLCTEPEYKNCLLVRITDVVVAKHLVLFLEEKIKGSEFSDYLECFQEDGALLTVFRYSTDSSLTAYLENEACGRRERAEIAKGILERLLILNPHPYFACAGLQPEQITVSRSIEVHLNYHFEDLEHLERYSMREIGQQLQKVFLLLFAQEYEKKLYPLLENYLQRLEVESEWTYLKLYQEFLVVYEDLLREAAEEQLPKTIWFQAWEKIKKAIPIAKKILQVVILLAAGLYVIQQLQDNNSSYAASQTMSQIGELIIEEQKMP